MTAAEKTKTLDKYREMAQAYMQEYSCRWSEACLAIKRRNPGARAAFGAPPIAEPR